MEEREEDVDFDPGEALEEWEEFHRKWIFCPDNAGRLLADWLKSDATEALRWLGWWYLKHPSDAQLFLAWWRRQDDVYCVSENERRLGEALVLNPLIANRWFSESWWNVWPPVPVSYVQRLANILLHAAKEEGGRQKLYDCEEGELWRRVSETPEYKVILNFLWQESALLCNYRQAGAATRNCVSHQVL